VGDTGAAGERGSYMAFNGQNPGGGIHSYRGQWGHNTPSELFVIAFQAWNSTQRLAAKALTNDAASQKEHR
jgi:hypothetical protein